VRFNNFSDGLWLPEGIDFGVPPNALLVANNIEYTTSGGVRGRRGRTRFVTLASPIISLWRHYPRTGSIKTLAAIDSGSAVKFQDASGTSSTFADVSGGGSLTTAMPWYFTNWSSKNKSFLANGSNPLKSYDGSAIASVSSVGTAGYLNPVPDGPYLVIHKARLWATKSSELNYSVYASNVNDETSFLATNQLSVNDPKGGVITGLASFFDFLLIFKSSSIWRFVGDIGTLTGAQLARYCDRGCTAPNSIAVTPFGVIFVGKDGVWLTDGTQPVPQELSAPIRSLFTARASETAYASAVGTWYPRKQMYVLKLDPTASEAWVLQRIQVLYENPYIGAHSQAVWIWSKHTSLPCAAGTTMSTWFSDTDDGRLMIGDANGKIWVYDADSTTTDDGTAIVSSIQTASRPMDASGRTGCAYRAKVLFRGTQALTGSLFYDQHTSADSSFTAGSVIGSPAEFWRRASIFDFAKQGRFVSVSVSNPSDSYQFELNAIDLDVRLRSRRVWRETN
jgi:hypothetical protein